MDLEERAIEVGKQMKTDLERVPSFARAPIEKNLNRIMMLIQLIAHRVDVLEGEKCQSR